MENNKLLFAIFTICIVILVLLVVQMCILVPAMMNSAHAQAPSFGVHHCCPPRFWCHPHKMMPPKPGFLPKAPAEPQAKPVPEPSK